MSRTLRIAVAALLVVTAVHAEDMVMMPDGDSPVFLPGTYNPGLRLGPGDTHTYYFNITIDPAYPFDMEIVVAVFTGDADLLVEGPVTDSSGLELSTPTIKVRFLPPR